MSFFDETPKPPPYDWATDEPLGTTGAIEVKVMGAWTERGWELALARAGHELQAWTDSVPDRMLHGLVGTAIAETLIGMRDGTLGRVY